MDFPRFSGNNMPLKSHIRKQANEERNTEANTTTVKPHFKLWAKKVEANEVTPQHPHKPFPGWVYGVLVVIFTTSLS